MPFKSEFQSETQLFNYLFKYTLKKVIDTKKNGKIKRTSEIIFFKLVQHCSYNRYKEPL